MLNCTPFLLFDGNCAEAMTFYQKCLGGELTLTKLADTPMKDQFPPEKHNRLINAHLESGAKEISATDWMASPALEPIQGNMFSLFVIGGTYDEVKVVFDKLSQGARKEWFQELHDLPFGTN
jgi:PhnB protein